MGAPVNTTDFSPISWTGDACEQFRELLASNEKISQLLGWLLNGSGELSDAVLDGIADRMVPVGTLIHRIVAVTPSSHWLPLNGTVVSRAEYPKLFALIGTTYGIGDGTTTFQLPNWLNRVPVAGGGDWVVGEIFGEKTHLLAVEEMPKHNHGNGLYTHLLAAPALGSITGSDTANSATEANTTTSAAITEKGGDVPHNNLQPSVAVHWMVKAK